MRNDKLKLFLCLSLGKMPVMAIEKMMEEIHLSLPLFKMKNPILKKFVALHTTISLRPC